jgi:hypothetical protein
MTDIVKFYLRLTNASSLLETIDPAFLNGRLSNYLDENGYAMAHYFVPSNAAFAAMPPGDYGVFKAPSNRALATYLLEFGYTTQSVDANSVRLRRDHVLISSEKGLEMTLVSMRGATRV